MDNENTNIQLLKIADEIIGVKAILVEEVLYNKTIVKHKPEQDTSFIGKLNYKNQEIPVLDLCLKFDLEKTKIIEETALVIVKIPNEENKKTKTIALLADKLLELVQMSSVNLICLPKIQSGLLKKRECFYGMTYCCRKFILLLDLENILKK